MPEQWRLSCPLAHTTLVQLAQTCPAASTPVSLPAPALMRARLNPNTASQRTARPQPPCPPPSPLTSLSSSTAQAQHSSTPIALRYSGTGLRLKTPCLPLAPFFPSFLSPPPASAMVPSITYPPLVPCFFLRLLLPSILPSAPAPAHLSSCPAVPFSCAAFQRCRFFTRAPAPRAR